MEKNIELKDSFLPTVNPADPYKLTDEEREIMNKLHRSFVSSEKLKKTYPLPVPLRMYVHGEQLKSAVPRLHTPECRRYAERCVHSRKNVQRKSLAGKGRALDPYRLLR